MAAFCSRRPFGLNLAVRQNWQASGDFSHHSDQRITLLPPIIISVVRCCSSKISSKALKRKRHEDRRRVRETIKSGQAIQLLLLAALNVARLRSLIFVNFSLIMLAEM